MTSHIRHYSGEPTLAQIRTGGRTEEKVEHPTLYLGDMPYILTPDGRELPLGKQDEAFFEELHDGDIVTINRFGQVFKLYDASSRDAAFYMTGQCNSNCIMCPESDQQRRFDEGIRSDWMLEFVDMLPPELEHAVITGGEPTLQTELFFRVLARLKEEKSNVETLILSNGRSFAAKSMVERLEACRPLYTTIAIPLHGHTAEVHDSITRTGGSFRQTCIALLNLHEINIPIELRVVVTKLNYRLLSDIARFIAERIPFAYVVNFVGLEVMGNCAKYRDTVYIDYADAFPYIKPAIEVLLKHGIDTSLYNYPLCAVDKGFWSICRKSITPDKVRFADTCEGCDAKSICGGVFFSTFHVAKPKLSPISFS